MTTPSPLPLVVAREGQTIWRVGAVDREPASPTAFEFHGQDLSATVRRFDAVYISSWDETCDIRKLREAGYGSTDAFSGPAQAPFASTRAMMFRASQKRDGIETNPPSQPGSQLQITLGKSQTDYSCALQHLLPSCGQLSSVPTATQAPHRMQMKKFQGSHSTDPATEADAAQIAVFVPIT